MSLPTMQAIQIYRYGEPEQLKLEQTPPLETLTRLIEEGHLTVTVGKTFALGEAQQAQKCSQSGHGRGRIVLRMLEEDYDLAIEI